MRSVIVLKKSTDVSLISLANAKLAFGIDENNKSMDAVLQAFIERTSGAIAVQCNRVFGRERVRETISQIGKPHVYLSRWPVLNIESVVGAPDWVLAEPESGLMTRSGSSSWPSVIEVTYTGGYDLPEESPLALQQAATMMTQSLYQSYSRGGGDAAIRMVSHKESRVMYYDTATQSDSSIAAKTAIDNLLRRYMRYEV